MVSSLFLLMQHYISIYIFKLHADLTSHFLVIPVLTWTQITPITDLLDTQFYVTCMTSDIDPRLISWIINGQKKSNINYTLMDDLDKTYKSILLLNPNNKLGQSVNIMCSVEETSNKSIELQGKFMFSYSEKNTVDECQFVSSEL